MKGRFVVLAVALVTAVSVVSVAQAAPTPPTQAAPAQAADDTPVAATSANCNHADLSDQTDTARNDPIWTPVLGDPNHPLTPDTATILQGTVDTPAQKFGLGQETSSSQAPSEVAEEDLPWNHYTHDKTADVLPDPGYKHLLSSWTNVDGTTGSHDDMEVEWENASLMGNSRTWGAMPEFVWPTAGDRVWVDGRWVFDCGHPGGMRAIVYDANGNGQYNPTALLSPPLGDGVIVGTADSGAALQADPLLSFVDSDGNGAWSSGETVVFDSNSDGVYDAGDWVPEGTAPASGTPLLTDPHLTETVKGFPVADPAYAQYSTEIHPPRGEVTFQNIPSVGDSWLPITGIHTNVPVAEANMFFSGNGGGANDLCSLIDRHIDATFDSIDACTHTGPVIPINDQNYVFDVYPPGTNYAPAGHDPSTPWPVTPPTPDASLQWRWIDQSYQIPDHACGPNKSDCVPMGEDKVLVCPIGASTPPPSDALDASGQMETTCPPAPVFPERATRLRVILPFNGTSYNVLAQSLLLGWDDVPATQATSVRTFKITLHQFDVVHNGESGIHSGDWRVFVDVGGQWRYMSSQFDTNANGDNACSGTSLDQINGAGGNGDGDCFRFDNSPWYVSVPNGLPIHVAVGGFESDSVDSDFCPQADTGSYIGCDPNIGSAIDLAISNDDRIGTYEFDLCGPNHDAAIDATCTDYSAPTPYTTTRLDDGEQYKTTFTVQEIGSATPPTSGPLSIGAPNYTDGGGTAFVTSSTPLGLTTAFTGNVGFQYRYYRDGTPLPDYGSAYGFDQFWTSSDFVAGPRNVPVYLNGYDGADGPYTLQYSAQHDGVTEPRHTAHLTLDNTPPAITINQPAATTYTHSQTLTLNYVVSDDAGSGVESVSPTIDGAATLAGHGLLSGQPINLLTELMLGPHTFTVNASDNVGNAGSRSVTFTIIVTAQSIIDDVTQFVAARAITQDEGTSLVSKLVSAKKARAAGNCANAKTIYQSFINEVQAQSGKKITAAAAAVLIADANYLIAHCP